MRPACKVLARFMTCLAVVFLCSSLSNCYSVLTHEEIVDLLWKDQLQPLLRKRFPQATDEDLREAHSYAYGGSVIQDMGYYPFGNKYFSDLVHYVRTGDFVSALLEQSSDLNEYAFALGALAHYASDNSGHPTINRVVAIDFPKLREKHGPEVTYEDDPKAHIRTEFGFDMLQVAKRRYTPEAYHDFIGFNVSRTVLERAFLRTYGIKLQDVIPDEDLAIGTFRRAVSEVIPEMTRGALRSRRGEIVRDTPNFNEKKFLYHLSRTDYEKEWDHDYQRPGLGARLIAFFLKIVPKIGPFKVLDFKIPTTQTEDMYVASVNKTVSDYATLLRQQSRGQIHPANLDYDTGRETHLGEYSLADKTYTRLLDDLSKQGFDHVSNELRANILAFYAHPELAAKPAKDSKSWRKIMGELDQLKSSVQVVSGSVSTPE